jgi:HK97 family phage portal protein
MLKTIQNIAQKALGLSHLAAAWAQGLDLGNKTPGRPTYPYKQCEMVFICVEKIVNSISGLQLVLSTGNENIVESGPVYDALFNNPAMNFENFITETVGHYALTRDVFWIFTDMAGLAPREIMVVSGLQMKAVTDTSGRLIEWEFIGANGIRARFGLTEVYQIKNFNPYDKFHGAGPLNAAELSISQAYQAALLNESSLANGAEPGLLLTTAPGVILNSDEKAYLRDTFDSRHRGAANVRRTAVLSGGVDAKTLTMKLVDLQAAELLTMSEKRICACFGVPAQLAGLDTEAQYSQGPAQKEFLLFNIVPQAQSLADHITRGILSRFYSSDVNVVSFEKSAARRSIRSLKHNKHYRQAYAKAPAAKSQVFAWFDCDSHPVMQEMQRDNADKVLKFKDAGIPLNSLIVAHDLPYEEVPWGNDWWISMGQVPASLIMEAGLEGITGPKLPEGDDGSGPDPGKAVKDLVANVDFEVKDGEASRLRLWRNWIASWAGIEREYSESMRKYFVRQQREVIESLQKELGHKSTKDTPEQTVARIVFNIKKDDGKLRAINQVFFEKASELGIRQAVFEVMGKSGPELSAAADAVKRSQAIRQSLVLSNSKITGVNAVTQKKLAASLLEGLKENEGLPDLTKRIQAQLGANRARSLSIARTQTGGAISSGRHAGFKHAGVELKTWVTSRDENVRDTHKAAEKEYAKGLELDEAFWVGGEKLMHPGDPHGTPGNVINCRCVEVAIKAQGKSFNVEHWSNCKFYSYSDMKV